MQLTSLLSPETIRVGLPGSDKDEVIGAAVDLLAGDARVLDLEEVRKVVFEREAQMSTGVGKGLGLPHGKTSSMTASAGALCVTAGPVEFQAFDAEPVRIVFLLVGPPDAQSIHIRTLSRISRIMNNDDLRQRILDAERPEVVFEIIAEAEKAILEA